MVSQTLNKNLALVFGRAELNLFAVNLFAATKKENKADVFLGKRLSITSATEIIN